MSNIDNADAATGFRQPAANREYMPAFGVPGAPGGSRHICLSCYIQGTLDANVARAAWIRVVDRHPLLRTIYKQNGAALLPYRTEGIPCDFESVDLDRGGAETPYARIRRESQTPLDPERGPLLRARLFILGRNGCILLLCGHPVAVDYGSLRILMREFDIVYTALAAGRAPELTLPPATYCAGARWQFRLLEAARGEGPPPVSQVTDKPVAHLPLDRALHAGTACELAELRFELPAVLTERLRTLAVRSGETPASIFLAAYTILLSRYGSAETVQIMCLADGRTDGQYEGEVGNCSHLVPIVAECVPNLTFPRLVAQVSMKDGEATERDSLPVAVLAVSPSRGIEPRREFYYVWEEGDFTGRIAGLPFQGLLECGHVPGGFDLGLKARSWGAGVRLSFLYRADLFDASTIRRMSRHFLRLLESIARSPESPISHFELMTDEERRLVLGSYAGEERAFPRACLHELFAEQVALRPEAEALVFDGRRVTYRELDLRSNRIAQFLRTNGLRSGEPVGIFMNSSPDMIAAIVGILKAGGAYAPIDPAYPAERIDFMLRDLATRWTLTNRQVNGNLSLAEQLVYVDDPDSPIAAASEEAVPCISSPDSVAAVIYTSGSTGQPKGALIPHRAVVRGVRNANYLEVTPRDRVAQAMSPSFDVCIIEVWSALANGAALIGLPQEVLLSPPAMASALSMERVSVLFLSTAYLHQIGRTDPGILKDVRIVMFGGEAAEPGPLRNILKHGPPARLLNCYGPTEAAVTAAYHRIAAVPDDAMTVPIGRPASNVRMYLLDNQMRPVPLGLPGEIYIGGEIGHGYWNRAGLNRERFVADTISGIPGSVLYRTGDLARLRENGDFEFIGRADQQVKIRGYRIELPEVQIALASHPDVKQAFVIAREDHPGDKRLVAYVTLKRELRFHANALRDYLAGRLPAYMVPAAIVQMSSIPLTPNGKIDRAALPPPSDRPAMATESPEPATEMERVVTRIWKELLAVDGIGPDDNFFDLGGDSLLGMRLMAALRDMLAVELPLHHLFNADNLRNFCAILENEKQQSGRLGRIFEETDPTPATRSLVVR